MQNCDMVVISVKPNAVPGVLKEILPLVTKNHLVTSIAAGISLALLEEVSDLVDLRVDAYTSLFSLCLLTRE